jgi:predicted lipid-binding transport protein (Tim44 family)
MLAAIAVVALALAPAVAEARAGSGSSSGSRGSRTQTAPPTTRTAPETAAPMQRTQTPSTPSTPSATAPAAGAAGAAAAAPSRSGTFMAGLAGGLIGVGLGGLLLGHGMFGGGLGFAGILGLLLQIALVGGIVYLLVRLFRGRSAAQPAMAQGPNALGRDMMDGRNGPMMGGSAGGAGVASAQPSIAVTPADYQRFEQVLIGIQAAWTGRDLPAMQRLATPEMITYFGEDLAEHDRRGVRNQVSQVRLLSGDLAEAWAEGEREYATVAMKFGMIDVTVDAQGRVVDGNPNQPVTATEVWTFVRFRGGDWMLSAIQQTR